MAGRQYAPPASCPSSMSSFIDNTCAGTALSQKKTFSRTMAFETGGNSHARLLWQSRWKIRSAIQPLPQNPHPHLQARRFRFVQTFGRQQSHTRWRQKVGVRSSRIQYQAQPFFGFLHKNKPTCSSGERVADNIPRDFTSRTKE